MSKADRDNHANQMNPNNDAYWQTRGHDERPEDWQEAPETEKKEAPRRNKTTPKRP